jgi:hypothetical protein
MPVDHFVEPCPSVPRVHREAHDALLWVRHVREVSRIAFWAASSAIEMRVQDKHRRPACRARDKRPENLHGRILRYPPAWDVFVSRFYDVAFPIFVTPKAGHIGREVLAELMSCIDVESRCAHFMAPGFTRSLVQVYVRPMLVRYELDCHNTQPSLTTVSMAVRSGIYLVRSGRRHGILGPSFVVGLPMMSPSRSKPVDGRLCIAAYPCVSKSKDTLRGARHQDAKN